MSDSPYVSLRNKTSGVSEELTHEAAERLLNHPFFGPHYEVVRTAKPEVLGEQSKADLVAQIEELNLTRDVDDQISTTGNKPDLIAAIESATEPDVKSVVEDVPNEQGVTE